MKRQDDVRAWLRASGHEDVLGKIDAAMRKWAREGKKTRRNWWDILAGGKNGAPRQVRGIVFPVLEGARRRQSTRDAAGAARSGKSKAIRSPTRRSKTDAGRSKAAATAARDPTSPSAHGRPKPFVKWAGGKRQLLSVILRHVPAEYGRYHEPFLGGGAVFFALSPKERAFLSDSNKRLVRCYNGIKNHVTEVISLLKGFEKSRRFFLEMRDRNIDQEENDAEVAAWFIFLNKMGFNGLYRVNSKNRFNVPFGDNQNAQICDQENLMACHRALGNAEIRHEDFSTVASRAQPGDLVYFDPPYLRLSATSYFTSYTAEGFTLADQHRLRDLAIQLKQRGVHIILSNSWNARSLYQNGAHFSIRKVLATRAVNSRADRRGKIAELLIS